MACPQTKCLNIDLKTLCKFFFFVSLISSGTRKRPNTASLMIPALNITPSSPYWRRTRYGIVALLGLQMWLAYLPEAWQWASPQKKLRFSCLFVTLGLNSDELIQFQNLVQSATFQYKSNVIQIAYHLCSTFSVCKILYFKRVSISESMK